MEIPTPDGGHIWVDVEGSGEPVVLISGMSQDHRALAAQRPLASEFSLIFMDNRGTGASSDWYVDDFGPTTGDMAEDVIAVLDGLGHRRAHVLGYSMGGRVAQWVAVRFPKRVGALVLVATSPGERHGVPRSDDVDLLLTANPVELALLNYSSKWMAKHQDLVSLIQSSTTERGQQRQAHYQATHGHDSWRSLSRIKAPTLVIHGSDDRINAIDNARLLAEEIPDAELLELPGGRHGAATEFADTVNARIAEFLHAHPLDAG